MTHDKPIVILGPTAGGKSDLAVALAERLGGEVIGADAFQVYRKLDAGTAKPDLSLRERAPHHLIDVAETTQRFTVHDWLGRAYQAIDEIQSRGRRPIIVGGTNLYMKVLLDGMFEGPGQDVAYRRSLDGIGTPLLHMKLMEVDKASAGRIKPMDRQRIVRALEVFELTGKPISELQTEWAGEESKGLDAMLVGLRWEAEAINPRINLRVKAMFYPDKVDPELAAGVCINGESLIDEANRLRDEGHFEPIVIKDHAPAPNQAREALGYKQLLAWVEGGDDKITSLEEAFEKTKVLTRRFAKQQRTWLKRFAGTAWIEGERYKAAPEETLDALVGSIGLAD
ncbi:MAG: tRNA (adenosine(37)-N6)-dimethylallyltransferase MiaA [Phycisphaeraceae bacterium]|nr:tRNA (adenosine(37)-N6)-dimethylallyltransferase MiaA [Phycisphaeraceae bacterium]